MKFPVTLMVEAGFTVIVRPLLPVPKLLVADTALLNGLPVVTVGVPVIAPVEVFTEAHPGRDVAP